MTLMQTISRTALAIVLTLTLFWGALYYWAHYTVDGQIDACLDNGGRWDNEQAKCDAKPPAP